MNSKSIIALSVLVLATVPQAAGDPPAPQHSLSMEVRPMASGGAVKSDNSLDIKRKRRSGGAKGLAGRERVTTENYSSSRKRGSGVGLQVEVRNLGQTADRARVEWYFLGKPVTRGEQFIFDHGSKVVSLNSASRQLVDIESAELTSTVNKNLTVRSGSERNYRPSAKVTKSGSKLAGWIVRLIADGQVLQVRASAPSLETIGRNQAQLAALRRNTSAGR